MRTAPKPDAPRKSKSRETILGLAAAVVSALGLVSYWGQISRAASIRAFVVAGGSMSPTFEAGDRVCIEKESDPRPEHGDIWIFRFPEHSPYAGDVGIKRVVGVPGDVIEVKNGRLFVDGRPREEPYLDKPPTYVVPRTVLGDDQYFVLGDDRDGSSDSHSWGLLPRDHFVGRVKYRVWPFSKFGEVR